MEAIIDIAKMEKEIREKQEQIRKLKENQRISYEEQKKQKVHEAVDKLNLTDMNKIYLVQVILDGEPETLAYTFDEKHAKSLREEFQKIEKITASWSHRYVVTQVYPDHAVREHFM